MIPKGYKPESSNKIAGFLPRWAVNAWIAFVLSWFFVIRILGSGTGRHLLSAVEAHLHR